MASKMAWAGVEREANRLRQDDARRADERDDTVSQRLSTHHRCAVIPRSAATRDLLFEGRVIPRSAATRDLLFGLLHVFVIRLGQEEGI
jgi:hypothetical protein